MSLESFTNCAELARQRDRERYLCALFAPDAAREAVFALLAFNAELAMIPEVTREAMMGLIRFAWWREALDEIYAGAPVRAHPVALALKVAIACHDLPRSPFDALLTAREGDLEREGFFDLAALEAYARDSSGSLLTLCLHVVQVEEEAALETARLLGTAYAMTGLLRALPHHARLGRLYLPENLISEEAEDELMEGRFSLDLGAGIARVAGKAEEYIGQARAGVCALPRRASFLKSLAWLTRYHLGRLRRARYDVFVLEKQPPSPLLPLRLMLRW